MRAQVKLEMIRIAEQSRHKQARRFFDSGHYDTRIGNWE